MGALDVVEFAEAEPEYEPFAEEESAFAEAEAVETEVVEAEVVDFAPRARVASRPADFSLRKDYRLQLASRLDTLMGEFVKLQVELLNDSRTPMTAQRRIARLFSMPVTGRVAELARRAREIRLHAAIDFRRRIERLTAMQSLDDVRVARRRNVAGLPFARDEQRVVGFPGDALLAARQRKPARDERVRGEIELAIGDGVFAAFGNNGLPAISSITARYFAI